VASVCNVTYDAPGVTCIHTNGRVDATGAPAV